LGEATRTSLYLPEFYVCDLNGYDVRKLKRSYSLPIMLGFLGAILILIATARYGIGLSSDSVAYISAAQNITAGHGYYNYRDKPVLVFPPFYSTVLSVFSAGQLQLHIIARYINAICFGLIVGIATRWMIINTKSLPLSLIGATAIIFSKPLVEVSVFAWSEPLFIVLTLLALFQMERFSPTEKYQPILLAGVYTALACLTRYAGVALLITGCLLLVLEQRKYSFGQWVKRLATFVTVAVLPFGLWLLRNYFISGSLTGGRVASKRPLMTNIRLMVDVLTSWILPDRIPLMLRIALAGLLLIGLTLMIIFVVRRNTIALRRPRYGLLIPILLFIPVYLAFLITSVSLTALSPIDNRYLAPIYVPVIFLIIFVFNEIKQVSHVFFGRQAVTVALLFGLALWLIYPVGGTIKLMRWYLTYGAGGFHSTQWVDSELIAYLKNHTLPGIGYTNEVEAVYVLTQKIFKGSPRKYRYESSTPTDDLLRFEQDLRKHGYVYLIMFDGDWWRDYLYDSEFFKSKYALDEVVTRQDGAIYRVELQTSD
jgi:hypothetical protein